MSIFLREQTSPAGIPVRTGFLSNRKKHYDDCNEFAAVFGKKIGFPDDIP